VEARAGDAYVRSLRLAHGAGVAELAPGPANGTGTGWMRCTLRLDDLRDLGAAVQRCRRLLDLDADASSIGERLGGDPLLGPLVARAPGRRVPGCVDGAELAVRAVLGQQVSVAGARTAAGRLTARWGTPLRSPVGDVTRLFPDAATLAASDLADLPLPQARRATLRTLAGALADGTIRVDAGADRAETTARLRALRGIGPWTAAYVAMRALGDPDAFPAGDLGVRRALERLGLPADPPAVSAAAERWRPWRAYATQYLWGSLR
jgi:AraC family transcriptional regulator of adaptative response / DNA-3-methyladenine glycosylase II